VICSVQIRYEKVVALQLCYDIDEDAFGVRLSVGANVEEESRRPRINVLTVVATRADNLLESQNQNSCTYIVCDPGGILRGPHHEAIERLTNSLMGGSLAEAEVICNEIWGAQNE
jgi:hypothetical protein